MLTVDQRTRRDDDIVAVDAADFFGRELPERIVADGDLARPGAIELQPRALAIDTDDGCWTLALDEDQLVVRAGDDGAPAKVRLDGEQLTDLVHDVRTPMGFLTGGDLQQERGRLDDLLDWWVVLRSLLDRRPAHTTGAVAFAEADGEPLDLHQGFDADAADDELAHFLGQAGFLHLRSVFTEDEMAQISRDMDAAFPHYAPDDGRSWWATTGSGEHRAVRLQHFHEHSPTTAGLLEDERLTRLARLTSDGHRPEAQFGGNAIEALVKPLDVVAGISDLPWHKDCSLGRHSYRCCSMTVGISVTGADASSGQLRVVAGSHRALVQPAFVRRGLDLPEIDLPTRTGDVTVHLSCTLHMSQAPRTAERRVLYTGFRLPDEGRTSPETAAKLSRIREGSYKTVSQPKQR
ncbi:MAG TPA: phytanoyl-CoA dioxygenase family protein [Acidimicrobiales bacterium]|nr:phytanoyl-CoA dioxygenase family protein [Acidimicrobiales bacterium]